MQTWTLENGVPSGEFGTFSYIFFSKFNRGAKAARNISAVYEDNAIGENTAKKRCSRFKEDRFDISDTPRSGRFSWFDEDRLNTSIHNDPRQCTRELANVMNCDHSTIVRHLHSKGKGRPRWSSGYRTLLWIRSSRVRSRPGSIDFFRAWKSWVWLPSEGK